MADHKLDAVPLETVLKAEHEEIAEMREHRHGKNFNKGGARDAAAAPKPPSGHALPEDVAWKERDKAWVEAVAEAHAENYVGLAFSGGGIRSATFNLGVLQALAELKLLGRVDYLSTVSGGGYIGSWMAAWSKREHGFLKVQDHLATSRVNQKDDREPTPIRFLRVFSNYLTPKAGFFSGDTWAMIAIYVRNMLLNQVIVLAMVAAALLAPRVLAQAGSWMTAAKNPYGPVGYAVAGFLLLLAFVIIANNMEYLDYQNRYADQTLTKSRWVLWLAAAPLFADAILGTMWLKANDGLSFTPAVKLGVLIYPAAWLAGWILEALYTAGFGAKVQQATSKVAAAWGSPEAVEQMRRKGHGSAPRPASAWETVFTLAGAAAAGALGGALFAVVAGWMHGWSMEWVLTFGVPMVAGILMLVATLHIGLMGVIFSDRRREWWGRLGGYIFLWSLVWMAGFWVALCFPGFLRNSTLLKATLKKDLAKYLTPAWIVSTISGVLAGKSKASGDPAQQTWQDYLAKAAPYAFVVGLVCWVSYGISELRKVHGTFSFVMAWSSPIVGTGTLHEMLAWLGTQRALCAMLGCAAIALLMAWRVDINQFSMHLFYRNRLARCYLGASNKERRPNRFTGFDASDDIPLKAFVKNAHDGKPYDGPYLVMNSSLNLVKGKDLAWQERMAESFVMTPRYCGYDVWLEEQDSPMLRETRDSLRHTKPAEGEPPPKLDRYGYRPTADYAYPPPDGKGFLLGTAMGISGAAASPNMGFYTTAATAFLMTVFNVRLGQWSGNTRSRNTWQRSSPWLGLSYLLNELVGGTDDEARYVYLSDGGHFENLAIYELVKRRCGLIIVGDAECDPNYEFDGLGNAIRKCRIDLGINIDLDVSEIKPEAEGKPSKKHYAVGQIHYETVDINAPTGTIIYFKASLTGDEPADVMNYHQKCDAFPHETTADQWFSETQFESYRELGYHEVMKSLNGDETKAQVAAAGEKPAGGAHAAKKPAEDPDEQKVRKAWTDFHFDTTKLHHHKVKAQG